MPTTSRKRIVSCWSDLHRDVIDLRNRHSVGFTLGRQHQWACQWKKMARLETKNCNEIKAFGSGALSSAAAFQGNNTRIVLEPCPAHRMSAFSDVGFRPDDRSEIRHNSQTCAVLVGCSVGLVPAFPSTRRRALEQRNGVLRLH